MRIGTIVLDGRLRRGMSKSELAERSGVSRQMVAAVEADTANPTLDIVAALLDGLRLDIEVVARGPVNIGPTRQRDPAHARCSAYLQRRFDAAGWLTAREVRIEDGRYVGWIDLLAFHEASGTLLIIEIKTRIDDLGAIERSIDWYQRAAVGAARRLGWTPTRAAPWLVALATDEVDEGIRANRSALALSFPVRAAEMSAMMTDPAGSTLGRGLALIDPRSRRREPLMRTRVDGRRSAAPYEGYADFMRRSSRR